MERQLAEEKVRELRQLGAAARLRMLARPRAWADDADVLIREARPVDDRALAALAALDSAEPPQGRILVAEVNGSIRAALPLDGSRVIADPFRRTADLVALLEARAKQLAADPERASRQLRVSWLARFV